MCEWVIERVKVPLRVSGSESVSESVSVSRLKYSFGIFRIGTIYRILAKLFHSALLSIFIL